MVTSGISEIGGRIEPVLSGNSDVVAAYLFGSAAKNRMRPGSDIDIALLLAEGGRRPDRKVLLERLLPPLCRALRGDVHLLLLNDASYLARSQVFKSGRLLYVRDQRQLTLFRMKSAALFADFAPCLRLTQKGLQKRLRQGHGG